MSELEQERQFANENVTRLEENLRARDAETSQISQRVLDRETEIENLHEEISAIKREHTRLVNEQTRALHDAVGQENENQIRMDQLVRAKAEADVEIKSSRDRIIALKEEVERLRRQVHSLQQESADKEVKIVQMTKQRGLDKEDIQGLNIALDSKQQELELVCSFLFSYIHTLCLILAFDVAEEEKWCQGHGWQHSCPTIQDVSSPRFFDFHSYTCLISTSIRNLRFRGYAYSEKKVFGDGAGICQTCGPRKEYTD